MEQRRGFQDVSRTIVALQRQRFKDGDGSETLGLLAIVDVNQKPAKVIYTSEASSAQQAMLQVLTTDAPDPCAVSGPKQAVAGFAQPTSLDLPNTYMRCQDLLNEAILLSEYSKAIAELRSKAKADRADIDQLSSAIHKLAQSQDANWREALRLLEAMRDSLE